MRFLLFVFAFINTIFYKQVVLRSSRVSVFLMFFFYISGEFGSYRCRLVWFTGVEKSKLIIFVNLKKQRLKLSKIISTHSIFALFVHFMLCLLYALKRMYLTKTLQQVNFVCDIYCFYLETCS